MAQKQHEQATPKQADDRKKEEQYSHRDTQNRTKKDGHATQLGTGGDQTSSRQHGGGARR